MINTAFSQRNKLRDHYNMMLVCRGFDNAESNSIKTFSLKRNYPNPFNPLTFIEYSLESINSVNLSVFDIHGRIVKTLVNKMQSHGKYTISFNGSSLASGIYFYKIKAGNFEDVKRMILIK